MNEDKHTLAMKKKKTFEMQDVYEKIQVLNNKVSLSCTKSFKIVILSVYRQMCVFSG